MNLIGGSIWIWVRRMRTAVIDAISFMLTWPLFGPEIRFSIHIGTYHLLSGMDLLEEWWDIA